MLLKKKLIYTSLNKKFSLTEPIVCKILNVLVIGKLKSYILRRLPLFSVNQICAILNFEKEEFDRLLYN